jgi:hypothetical protein
MTGISQENQNLAQFVGKVFGDDWNIAEHRDEQNQIVIYVLSGTTPDITDVTSHATIGLSDYKLGQDKSGIALGCELVSCVRGTNNFLDRALAEVANAIRTQNLLPKPGLVFANALNGYGAQGKMQHFLFTVPSLWENTLYPLQFKTKTVLWLQAVPITDREKQFAEQNGAGALGEKLSEAKADLADFDRKSVA